MKGCKECFRLLTVSDRDDGVQVLPNAQEGDYRGIEINESEGEARWRVRKVTKLWKCKDGTKVRICDMTDKHLVNTMKMLERSARAQEHELLAAGNPFQGDIASYMFDQEQDILREEGVEVSDLYPIYKDLLVEAQRRKLAI